MKTFLHFSTSRPQNPDIVFVKLHPENENERKLLDESNDIDTIELYYHIAVQEKLPGYVVLRIIDMSLWPHAAELSVQKIIGIG
ncbi:MAG TPA: hypothetical protein PK185_17290 [Cyclobacteriaceae bacterium]|nr:hypothetical protein [Cyclobacteriaceae bacterium]